MNVIRLLPLEVGKLNARNMFDRFHGTGLAQDAGREQLLNPIICIIDKASLTSEAKVIFSYPEEKNKRWMYIETSHFQIVSKNPLRIQFQVNDGQNHGQYEIIKDFDQGTWSGYFIQNGQPLYLLTGIWYELAHML